MSVDPDSSELFRTHSRVDLLIKEVGNGFVVEGDVGVGAILLDKNNVVY